MYFIVLFHESLMLTHMFKYLALLGLVAALFIGGVFGYYMYQDKATPNITEGPFMKDFDRSKLKVVSAGAGPAPAPTKKTATKEGEPAKPDTPPADSKDKTESKDKTGTKPPEDKQATPPKSEAAKPDAGKQPEKTPPAPPK